MPQPKWTIDETLLAVDTYFQIGDVSKITADHPLVVELSDILRSLPIHKKKDEIFRNIPGIRMTLFSLASLDKDAQYHLRKASNLQKKVYDYYETKINELYLLCNAIRNCIPLTFDYSNDICTPFEMMGSILYQFHRSVEIDNPIAKQLKRAAVERRRSACMLCKVDLFTKYGEKGIGINELHYSYPIVSYKSGMDILQSKFIPLCPNCHCYVHMKPEFFDVEEAKQGFHAKGVYGV